jgi:hypothetical protein
MGRVIPSSIPSLIALHAASFVARRLSTRALGGEPVMPPIMYTGRGLSPGERYIGIAVSFVWPQGSLARWWRAPR